MKRDEQTVLQGGGALGAYQAGVYEGIAEAGLAPDWIAGVSIGAINAALIAGNPPERRVARLREFWERVSSDHAAGDSGAARSAASDTQSFERGNGGNIWCAGLLCPRQPPGFLAPDGTPEALSVYDTSPLRETLLELVDFDLLNRQGSSPQRWRRRRSQRQLGLFDSQNRRSDRSMSWRVVRSAGVSANRNRRRPLLGRRACLEFAAMVRLRRFTAD